MRRADNLTNLHVPIVLKSGSLNLLEPSGRVQACTWFAAALPDTKVVIQYLILKVNSDAEMSYRPTNGTDSLRFLSLW